MENDVLALVISGASKLISELIRYRPIKFETTRTITLPEITRPAVAEQPKILPIVSKATAVPTGCLPCSLGHFSVVSGLLNEAVRFAKGSDLSNDEVILRINMSLDELNALERVDLRSEMIVELPAWEKVLADKVLLASRNTRHILEGLKTPGDLEKAAALVQSTRNQIGKEWFKTKLSTLTPEDRQEVEKRVAERLEKNGV